MSERQLENWRSKDSRVRSSYVQRTANANAFLFGTTPATESKTSLLRESATAELMAPEHLKAWNSRGVLPACLTLAGPRRKGFPYVSAVITIVLHVNPHLTLKGSLEEE